MRKKLTLRPKFSVAGHEKNIKEEIADGGNSVEEDEALNECNKEEEQDAMLTGVKAKKLFQRASPMKFVRIYPSITKDQQRLIRYADYGGLLDIKCSRLRPECAWGPVLK